MRRERRTNTKQHDISDCAAACIASIAKWYGFNIPITIIREASGTTKAGTTIKGILDACPTIGFIGKGYKSNDKEIDPLIKAGCPMILHTTNKKGDLHFIVLYSINHKRAIIMDPADGTHHKITIDELKEEWSGYLVVLTPDPDFKGERGKSNLVQRYLSLLKLIKRELSLTLLGSFVLIAAGISTSLFIQHIIDEVLPSNSVKDLSIVGGAMIVIMIFSLFVGYFRILYILRAGIKTDSILILKYMRHLFKLPTGFFSQRGAGELNSRIGDAMKIRNFLTSGMIGLFVSIFTLAFSFALMFTYYWKLALLTLLFMPLYVALYLYADRINKKVNREIIENAAAFEEKTVESISSVRTIKYFGNEELFYKRIERQYVTLADKMYKGGKYLGVFETSSDAISKMLTVALLIVGSAFIFKGGMSVGELVSFYSLTAYFSAPLSQLVSLNSQITEANISAERLFDIIDLEVEGLNTIEFPLDGFSELIMKDITFSYPGCETLLEDFNLTIKKGSITAIRGESGCGKSSLASLIMRGYKIQKGKILADNTDINLIDLGQWRRFVSIVPQEPELMNCTILDNITCCENEPDIKKVVDILSEIGLNEFVAKLPFGILTKIGEQGGRLSGGQRQRIAFARALYRDPQILILDEATSSLDNESQQYILNKLVDLKQKGKSIIMITHKMDNALIADNIIDMSAHSIG